MIKKVNGLGVLNNILIIAAAIIVSAFSFVYKRLLLQPLENAVERMLIPLFETLDDEYNGIIVFLIFLIELLITLIIPWFFSWVIGVIIVSYLLITVGMIFYLMEDDTKKWKISFFIIWLIPYLTMAFLPTTIITIIRKKEKPEPTIIQIRRTKLKCLKKKIRYNRLKFWKKWIG